MSNITTLPVNDPISLGTTDAIIEGYRQRLADLTADTKAGYEAVKSGLGELVKLRTGVERSRKELKANALEYGRKVDREAKRVTALILEIEEPLKQRKLAVDNAIEIERQRAEEAKRAEHEAREREERERIAAEQAVERAKIRAEHEKFLAEKKEMEDQRRQMQEERDRMEAERREIEQEKERIEAARLQKIEDEKRAEKEAARLKYEAEEKAKREAKEEKERLVAIKLEKAAEKKRKEEHIRLRKERQPDIDRLLECLDNLPREIPETNSWKTDWGTEIGCDLLGVVTQVCDSFRARIE